MFAFSFAFILPEDNTDELELTEVNATFAADTFFPTWPREAFEEVRRETHPGTPEGGPGFDFVTYRRKSLG